MCLYSDGVYFSEIQNLLKTLNYHFLRKRLGIKNRKKIQYFSWYPNSEDLDFIFEIHKKQNLFYKELGGKNTKNGKKEPKIASYNFERKTDHCTISLCRYSRYDVEYDLYIRFVRYKKDNQMVKAIQIAKLIFRKERKGHGTALLKILVSFAQQYGYQFISIEGMNEKSRAFSKKLGFTSYIMKTADLAVSLNAYICNRQNS